MEPLRPPTPNPTGTATVEPLLVDPSAFGGAPLYPQFLTPLGADTLAVNDPNQFFPDGVPGYEPVTNPYATSPFFPTIPEPKPAPPVPIARPLPGAPQLPPTEELEDDVEPLLETPPTPAGSAPEILGSSVLAEEPPRPLMPTATSAPTTEEIPAEAAVPTGVATPSQTDLPQLSSAAPVDPEQGELPTAPEPLLETIQPESLTNIPEATAQRLQEGNLETLPAPAIPQQTPTAATPQPSVLSEQPPIAPAPVETTSVQTSPVEATFAQASAINAPQSIPDENRQIPEPIAPAFSQADRPERDLSVPNDKVAVPQEPRSLSEIPISPPAQIPEQIAEIAPVSEPGSLPKESATENPGFASEGTATGNPEVAITENSEVIPSVVATENPEALPNAAPRAAASGTALENPGQVPEVIPAEAARFVPKVDSPENLEVGATGVPDALPLEPLGNSGALPQASEARLPENPADFPAQRSEGNAVTLPEPQPQLLATENSQLPSVQVPEETSETVPQSLPDARSTESPGQSPETIPVASPETVLGQIPETIPTGTPEIPSGQIPEAIPPQSGQVPENVPVEQPEASSRQATTMPAEIPVASAPLVPAENREDTSERIPDVASQERSVVIPTEVPPVSLVVSPALAPKESPTPTPQMREVLAQNLEVAPIALADSEPDTVLLEQLATAPAETVAVLPEPSPEPEPTAEPLGQSLRTPAELPQQTPEATTAIPEQPVELPPRQPEMLSGSSPEAISAEIPSTTKVPGQRLDDTVAATPETRTEEVLPSQNQRLERAQVPQNIVPETPPESSAQTPELPGTVDSPTQRTERPEPERIDINEDVVPNIIQPSALIAPDDVLPEPVSESIPVEEPTVTPTIAATIDERSAQNEPEQEIPEQTQPLPSISKNADLQEQAQALYGALANRLVQLESGTPDLLATEALSAQELEAVSDTQSAVPAAEITPEAAVPTPSVADLSDQLDEEGQTALENILQSGSLPALATQSPENQLLTTQLPENQLTETLSPESQLTENQPPESQLLTTQLLENQLTVALPATPIVSGEVPAEEPQAQVPQAEQPPMNFRGAAALSALQDLQPSIFAEEPPTQASEVPEFPAVEPQEIVPEVVTSTQPALEDLTPNLETPQIPDQSTQTTADLDTSQVPDQPTEALEDLPPTTLQPEPLQLTESPQLLDGDTQQVQDLEENFLLPQAETATPLQIPGLGVSPFLPTALDNLSTFTPLGAAEPSTAQTNLQNFAPLTFAPLPQSPSASADTPQPSSIPGQPQSVLQPQSVTPPLEENQIAEMPVEPVSLLDGQTQEIPLTDETQTTEQSQEVPLTNETQTTEQAQEVQLPDETQATEQAQENQPPRQVQDVETSLEGETFFPPSTMVGTPADQEEAAFLGSMFAAAEPLGQAALDSLVQMPEARQLEVSNALPLARRPAAPTETPTPQAPTQQLQASAPTQQFTNTPDQESFEQPVESELAVDGEQPVVQPDSQTFSPSAVPPVYPQATTPLEFVSPQTTTTTPSQATTTPQIPPQTFEQTTPASPSQGYVQSTQPLVYRPASTSQADSSLADATKPVIDQSGIEELLNLGTDNHYEEPEAPSFEDDSSDENDTPLGQLFRQGTEKGPPLQRETIAQEPEPDASPTYTMEAPRQEEEDDDDDYGGGSGASIESLARRIYHMVRHRIDREKERHGGHQDRGGW
jgi:hypothetical protein